MLQKQDTNVLKGLAIMLMLVHHLFWKQNGLYDDIHLLGDRYLVNQIGIFAKVCVAIFVFLSGYGLTIQADGKGGVGKLHDFYLRRFKKLYLNYWFIWLIFVPISIFVFGRTFEVAFPEDTGLHVGLDLLGIHQWFFSKPYSYNATWWFYSCIISLYLLFPFLYKMMKKGWIILLLITIAVSFMPFSIVSVNYYIFIFVLGMLVARFKIAPPTQPAWVCAIMILLLIFCGEGLYNKYPRMMDGLITLTLVMTYQSVKWSDKILKVMDFLGKHSMNIFLFHTFIFSYWFKDFIYSSRNPFIIFFLLLGICVIISVILEQLKKLTIYKILK